MAVPFSSYSRSYDSAYPAVFSLLKPASILRVADAGGAVRRGIEEVWGWRSMMEGAIVFVSFFLSLFPVPELE